MQFQTLRGGLFSAALIGSVLGFSGCSDDDDSSMGPADGKPAFDIESPMAGASVDAPLLLRLKTKNIAYKVGGAAMEGQGHFHVFLDKDPDASKTNYTHLVTQGDTASLGAPAAGSHRIIVTFHNPDHSYAGLADTVMFTVKESHATVRSFRIESPAEGDMTTGNKVTLKVHAHQIAYRVGGMDEPGYGHFHVFLDSAPNAAMTNYTHLITAGDSVSLNNLSSGSHRVIVSFHNANHTYAGLSDTVMFRVEPSMGSAPAFSIESPMAGGTASGMVKLKLMTSNIGYKVGGPNTDGQGHFHVFLDKDPDASKINYTHLVTQGDTVSLGMLSAGAHRVIVTFHNADHSYAGLADTAQFTVSP